MTELLRKIVLLITLADNFLTTKIKHALFKTKYSIVGNCKKCGNCCKKIYIKATKAQLKSDFFKKIYIKWIEWLFQFSLLEIDYKDCYFVFKCKNLKSDGTCGVYKLRPNICRDYPLLDYFNEPVFLQNCGFSARKNF